MFRERIIKRSQNLLGIKRADNVMFFANRLKKWIEQNGNIEQSILKGINTILMDIHKREIEEAKEQVKINFTGVKHPILRKYGEKIVSLHMEGLGARRIKKILELEHRAKISHTAIHNFLKQQKEENGKS